MKHVSPLELKDTGAGNDDLSGYRIVDRISFQMLRDPYSMATKGQTRFHSRKRVGGSITNPDRFVKLKVSAT